MNKLTIIGNLTSDPTTREVHTANGASMVCTFTVAVNRRRGGNDIADFFRVTAWNKTGENCAKFLAKGRKVAVTGSVSVSAYTASDGSARGSMEVNADEVEFLSAAQQAEQPAPAQTEFTPVVDNSLPF